MIQIRNYKETQELLSVSEYLAIYREWVAQGISNYDLSKNVHNLLINLSNVYLNYDNSNDEFAIAKNGYRYSVSCDKWALVELAKVKSVLAELREMEIPEYQTEMRVWENEIYFLSFVKMMCVLRYRPLLAHSWRVEHR